MIGRKAGERAVRRLGARKAATGPVDVVFDPRVARGIAGHLAGAINGASVARKTSFLRDMMGKQVASAAITVTDEPLRRRGQASRPFDGEGVEGKRLLMVEKGVLNHWFLSTSAARELGLPPTDAARAVAPPSRRPRPISPSSRANSTPEDLIKSLKIGFYVTEVFGQGVDMITGEYSRGASGFWIENGELAYPVAEVTIASNLKTMFLNMVPASDLDRNFGTAAPTLLIEGMTLAGADPVISAGRGPGPAARRRPRGRRHRHALFRQQPASLDEGRHLAGQRSRPRRRRLSARDLACGAAGLWLAVGGNRRRSRRALGAPYLRRRSRSTARAASLKACAPGASASPWSRTAARSPACSNARPRKRPIGRCPARARSGTVKPHCRAPALRPSVEIGGPKPADRPDAGGVAGPGAPRSPHSLARLPAGDGRQRHARRHLRQAERA